MKPLFGHVTERDLAQASQRRDEVPAYPARKFPCSRCIKRGAIEPREAAPGSWGCESCIAEERDLRTRLGGAAR